MAYANLKNEDPNLLKITKKDDEIEKLKYKTEKHDHENIIKFPEIDNEYFRKKYKSLIRKKVLLIISEILLGSRSAISTSTMSLFNPSIGIVLTNSTALSIYTYFNNE